MTKLVLYTTLDGGSNFLMAYRRLVKLCSSELLLVAHRMDMTFLRLLSEDLRALTTKKATFRVLLSSTHLEKTRSAIKYLTELCPRVELRISDRIHAKALVSDRRLVLMGSANAAGDGLGVGSEWRLPDHAWDAPNFEIGLTLNDVQVAQQIAKLILACWERASSLE